MSTPAFHSYPVADISTEYITEQDARMMLEADSPSILGVLGNGRGALLFLGLNDDVDENVANFREWGWSEEMQAIVRALSTQGFEYARFDSDGGRITGGEFPTFNW